MRGSDRLESELLSVAREVDGGLFLTGSRHYAGDGADEGADHDYRLIVADPGTTLRVGFLAEHAQPLLSVVEGSHDILGLKFERHGCLISLQLMSVDVVQRLCSLRKTTVRALRTTPTSTFNDVYGFERRFLVPQHHKPVSKAWEVEIDQVPRVGGHFVTQIYHNMLIGCRVVRDAHGLESSRKDLLRMVGYEMAKHGLSSEEGLQRLFRRSFHRYSASARDALINEFCSTRSVPGTGTPHLQSGIEQAS